MCAYNLPTKIQHSCIFLIHQKRKQPYKAVIYNGLSGAPPPIQKSHKTVIANLISHIKKTMCAYNLPTKIQHSCIFLIHQKRKQPYKAVIYNGLSGAPPPPKIRKSFLPTVSIQKSHKTVIAYLISHIKKTMCAYNLPTKIQHSCIFLIHQKRKQPYKAVIYNGLSGAPPPPPSDFGSFSVVKL